MAERPKVLIVEDEEDILAETKEILVKQGFPVFTAVNSDEAEALRVKERPRIYVIDVHMPKSTLDGIGVLQKVRAQDKQAYCIMLSRIDEYDKVQSAKECGADRYVLKPIDFSCLLKLLEEAAAVVAGRPA